MFGAARKFFHMGKIMNLPATHSVCWQLLATDGHCWALRHGQAFLPVSRKQNLIHVRTEMLSCPGRAATSTSLSSISSRASKAHIRDGGRQKLYFSLYVRRHELVHFIKSYMT